MMPLKIFKTVEDINTSKRFSVIYLKIQSVDKVSGIIYSKTTFDAFIEETILQME